MAKDSKLLGVLALLALAGVPAVAAAQQASYGSIGYGFIDAVRQRDGTKVLNYIDSNGAAMINFRNDRGESSLHVVTARRDLDWLTFLLGKGGDVNLPNGVGDTPLHLAARGGWDEGVQLLLDFRAVVDRPNKMGETPLIAAVQQHQTTVVRHLLEAGASPDRRDSASGRSARDYAKLDSRSSATLLQMMDSIKPKAARAVAGPKL